MMTKRLVLDEEAFEELQHAIDHYDAERAGLGVELADLVEEAFHALVNGTAAPVTIPGIPNDFGVRRILLDRFPFAVIHTDEPDAIHIVAVAHLKRAPGYWLDRLPRPGTPPPRKRR